MIVVLIHPMLSLLLASHGTLTLAGVSGVAISPQSSDDPLDPP